MMNEGNDRAGRATAYLGLLVIASLRNLRTRFRSQVKVGVKTLRSIMALLCELQGIAEGCNQ